MAWPREFETGLSQGQAEGGASCARAQASRLDPAGISAVASSTDSAFTERELEEGHKTERQDELSARQGSRGVTNHGVAIRAGKTRHPPGHRRSAGPCAGVEIGGELERLTALR